MNDTYVTLQGNLGNEVRFSDTTKGAVAHFNVAATPRYVDRTTGAWVDGKTTWYSVTAWRGLARNCAASLHKGDPVFVHGRLSARDWTANGSQGVDLEVEATFVGHDLNRGTTSFAKTGATTSPLPDTPPAGAPAATPDALASEEVTPETAAA